MVALAEIFILNLPVSGFVLCGEEVLTRDWRWDGFHYVNPKNVVTPRHVILHVSTFAVLQVASYESASRRW